MSFKRVAWTDGRKRKRGETRTWESSEPEEPAIEISSSMLTAISIRGRRDYSRQRFLTSSYNRLGRKCTVTTQIKMTFSHFLIFTTHKITICKICSLSLSDIRSYHKIDYLLLLRVILTIMLTEIGNL